MDPSSSAFPVQSVGASALPSVLLKNTQDWFPLELTGLISLLSKGTSTIFSSTTIWMHQFFGSQPSLWYNSTIWLYWPLSEKWCLHFLMHCLGLFESLTIKKKKSWVLKNSCFWTVVLEKMLESPLDCEKIKPVNFQGYQSWIFTGMTDAEAETTILWPPDAKNWLIRKDPDAGKDWR